MKHLDHWLEREVGLKEETRQWISGFRISKPIVFRLSHFSGGWRPTLTDRAEH